MRLGGPGPGPEAEGAAGCMCRVGGRGGPRQPLQCLAVLGAAPWRHPGRETRSALISIDFSGNRAQKLLEGAGVTGTALLQLTV